MTLGKSLRASELSFIICKMEVKKKKPFLQTAVRINNNIQKRADPVPGRE